MKRLDFFGGSLPCLLLACLLVVSAARGASPAPPLSLNFQSIELRAALQILAEHGGLDLVVSDAVDGQVTLQLEETSWRRALELILRSEGLQASEENGVLIVREAGESENAALRTEVFLIRYAEAEEIKELLRLRGEASCLVDERINALIVTDGETALQAHGELIAQLDVPVRQVLIEARVVVASTQASKQLGVSWRGSATKTIGSDGTLSIGSGANDDEGEGDKTSALVDLAIETPGASRVAVGYAAANVKLDVEISALESRGEAEIIAKPRVVTANRRMALVRSGVQIPYQESTSSGATSTSFQSATLSLQVTPRITSEESVLLLLKVTQDTVGKTYSGVPSINTNAIETEVLVEGGQTLVLGGVYQVDMNRSVSETPVLSKIPILGRLFRRTISSDDKRELLVFLTPKVLP